MIKNMEAYSFPVQFSVGLLLKMCALGNLTITESAKPIPTRDGMTKIPKTSLHSVPNSKHLPALLSLCEKCICTTNHEALCLCAILT